jgi:hypothetical protein
MRIIQNTYIGFRLPNTLKEALIDYAETNQLHVSQVIRSAVVKALKEAVSPMMLSNPTPRPNRHADPDVGFSRGNMPSWRIY